MIAILLLLGAIGIAPLMLGLAIAWRKSIAFRRPPVLGSILLSALAFNLIFFWQELWLVIPKALTPGLHPALFHNNHDWTGDAPIAELLQGSGAVATAMIGLLFAAILATVRSLGPTTRLFCFWMAFQGLSQALTQLAVGTILPGNDVGRALAYLGLGQTAHIALAGCAVLALAGSGTMLARLLPAEAAGNHVRASAGIPLILLSAILSIVLIVPFRVPRSPVETIFIPILVNLIGTGWAVLGLALGPARGAEPVRARIAPPALALLMLLLIFQLILRPGIRF
jgi:hypothetical protein